MSKKQRVSKNVSVSCLFALSRLGQCFWFLVTSWMPRSGKLSVLNCRYYLAHRPKIRFFAPQRRLVAPIQVKLDRADGLQGPLGYTKFHFSRHWGLGMRPQNIKNFHFLVNSRLSGVNPLTDFEKF